MEKVLNTSILDTKAQLGTEENKRLKNKAKRKFISSKISGALAKIQGSELRKSYSGSKLCNTQIYADSGSVTSHYCNARWCITCNKIRMAKLISGYVLPLEKLTDKHFVTLTVPNCKGEDLALNVREMLSCCKSIMETMKRRKQRGISLFQLVGIRKMECTYNSLRNDYHPHFHFIIQGKEAANELVREWVLRNPLCNINAQDIRLADDGSIVELFKYFAKVVGKNSKGDISIHIQSLDVIFSAMRGLRVFQPFGVIKDVTEDISGMVSEKYNVPDGVYDWYEIDWCNSDGEVLTGYMPDDNMNKLVNSIVTGGNTCKFG
jgi:plasmid rolling circle replication initiator protein Rep